MTGLLLGAGLLAVAVLCAAVGAWHILTGRLGWLLLWWGLTVVLIFLGLDALSGGDAVASLFHHREQPRIEPHEAPRPQTLARWPAPSPTLGLLLVGCAAGCAALVTWLLRTGPGRHPLLRLLGAGLGFLVMVGVLHDALLLIEPWLP